MNQSEAWIVQVRSDFAAGMRLFREDDPTTYCQAIAKYQQTVEKSVKVMVASVNDLGGITLKVTPSHVPTKEIDALLSLKRAIDNASINRLSATFDRYRDAVEGLCGLAPKWPDDGKSFLRNTEYPFATSSGWTAPADPTSFTLREAKDAYATAWAFHNAVINFVEAVKLGRR